MPQDREREKPRSGNVQKRYDEADNAGEFAGDDNQAKAARKHAQDQIDKERRTSNDRQSAEEIKSDTTDVLAHRNPTHGRDYKGEAQNINDDSGRPLTDEEAARARNKASEGKKES